MATNVESPGLLAEPGLPNKTATISVPFLISPNDNATQDLRLKFLARRLHALGEAPLFHLLKQLERGAELRPLLEQYAALPADLIRAYRGDRFTPPTFLVKEDGAA